MTSHSSSTGRPVRPKGGAAPHAPLVVPLKPAAAPAPIASTTASALCTAAAASSASSSASSASATAKRPRAVLPLHAIHDRQDLVPAAGRGTVRR